MLTDWEKMSNLYKRTFHRCFLPSFGSFVHAVSEEKIFRNRPIRNKNHLWWPCLLMDRDGMSKVSVYFYLAKQFQRTRFFRNQPIRNKNCLWLPCLLTDQNGMSNSHRGPSIDASYQVSVYFAKLCQSRRFFRN